MSIEEQVLEKLRLLPPEKHKEVLDFVDFLTHQDVSTKAFPKLRGLWKDLALNLRDEEIREARRKLWGSFPRDLA